MYEHTYIILTFHFYLEVESERIIILHINWWYFSNL